MPLRIVRLSPREEALSRMSRNELIGEIERLERLMVDSGSESFVDAVKSEAIHQREQWGDDHDSMKGPEDWFWLVGYIAGKAIRPGINGSDKMQKIVSIAAVCMNWHRHESIKTTAQT